MRLNSMFALITILGLLISAQVAAECERVNRSDNVVLMSCAQVVDAEAMVAVAKEECGEDKTCNVWFWSSEVGLPDTAPATDAELPTALTSKALAVWANDSGSLMTLKKKN